MIDQDLTVNNPGFFFLNIRIEFLFLLKTKVQTLSQNICSVFVKQWLVHFASCSHICICDLHANHHIQISNTTQWFISGTTIIQHVGENTVVMFVPFLFYLWCRMLHGPSLQTYVLDQQSSPWADVLPAIIFKSIPDPTRSINTGPDLSYDLV